MYVQVLNQDKANAKAFLISNIQSNISNIQDASNRIHDIISSMNTIIEGTPSGTDRRWLGCLERALQYNSVTNTELYQSLSNAQALDVYDLEWVDDDE